MVTGLACMVGVIALWSVVPVLVKLLLPAIGPFSLAALRLGQACLVVLAVLYLRGGRLRRIRLAVWHGIGGLGVSVNYALFALSLTFTTASTGVLVVQVQYVTFAALAAALLHERLGAARIAGMALVLGGVALVVSVRLDVSHLLAPRYAAGNLLMLLAGVGWGVYAVSNKALAGAMDTMSILLPMLGFGTAVTGLLAAAHGEAWDLPAGWPLAQLLVLGVAATGGAFLLVAEAIRRLSAALVGTATTATPLLQILLAHAVLDEPLAWVHGAGGALIVAGIVTMVAAERRGAKPSGGAAPRR